MAAARRIADAAAYYCRLAFTGEYQKVVPVEMAKEHPVPANALLRDSRLKSFRNDPEAVSGLPAGGACAQRLEWLRTGGFCGKTAPDLESTSRIQAGPGTKGDLYGRKSDDCLPIPRMAGNRLVRRELPDINLLSEISCNCPKEPKKAIGHTIDMRCNAFNSCRTRGRRG